MLIPRVEWLAAAPAPGRRLRTLGPRFVLATTLAAVLLITGWWSLVVEGPREGRPAGEPAGEAMLELATEARPLSTGTSAGPATAVGSAARTVPVECSAEEPSLGASWPSAADLAGALAARPPWITRDPIADPVTGNGPVRVENAERDTAPCTDGYFDGWSQTWFSLTATPIAAVSACVTPGSRRT